jgi:hypothetical protein
MRCRTRNDIEPSDPPRTSRICSVVRRDRPFDPRYHRACDTTVNIDREVLEQNTRALVRVLAP